MCKYMALLYWQMYLKVVAMKILDSFSGASESPTEQLQARHEAGGCGQEEPIPHLPCHHWRSEGRRGLHHV